MVVNGLGFTCLDCDVVSDHVGSDCRPSRPDRYRSQEEGARYVLMQLREAECEHCPLLAEEG